MNKVAGTLTRSEIGEAPDRFIAMVGRDLSELVRPLALSDRRAIYTIARGSSDAAANVIAFEAMGMLGKPVATLPPSVFSLGSGVYMGGATDLIVSQSGTSSDLIKACVGFKSRVGNIIADDAPETVADGPK